MGAAAASIHPISDKASRLGNCLAHLTTEEVRLLADRSNYSLSQKKGNHLATKRREKAASSRLLLPPERLRFSPDRSRPCTLFEALQYQQ